MSPPYDAPAPDRWRFGARSFRTKIVASTVALMAAALIVLGIGIQLLLDRTATRDLDRVLAGRADAMIAVVDESSDGGELSVPAEALEPGVQVYDAEGAAHRRVDDTRRAEDGPAAGGGRRRTHGHRQR